MSDKMKTIMSSCCHINYKQAQTASLK